MNELHQDVSGQKKKKYKDYLLVLDAMDWTKYDYKTWPCADLSFPDLDEDERHDVWPFKPNLDEPHWVDLNNQFPDGLDRRGFAEGFTLPDAIEVLEFDEAEDKLNELLELRDDEPEEFEEELKSLGFTSEAHVEWALNKIENAEERSYAAADEFLAGQQAMLKAQMDEKISAAEAGGLLDPIDGVDMKTWAAANAKIANGMGLEEVLAIVGVEKPVWDKLSADWNTRMSQDTTYAIASVYGEAFVNSNIGAFANNMETSASQASDVNPTGSNPKEDFDLYIKIMCHQSVGATQGKDAAGILKEYGLNVADWASVGQHWSMQMATNTKLAIQMSKLMEQYTAEFASGSVADDISF